MGEYKQGADVTNSIVLKCTLGSQRMCDGLWLNISTGRPRVFRSWRKYVITGFMIVTSCETAAAMGVGYSLMKGWELMFPRVGFATVRL